MKMAKRPENTEDDDLLELLEADIDEQLADDFDPDDLLGSEEEVIEKAKVDPTPKAKIKVGSLKDKTVTFYDTDDEETVTGKVTKHTKKGVTVDTGEYNYQVAAEDVTVVDVDEDEASVEEETEATSEEETEEVASEEMEVRKEVMVSIDSIRVPKKLVRQFRKGAGWDSFVEDFAKGQNDAIELSSITAKKPVLVDGLRRITALKERGETMVRAREPRTSVKTLTERLTYSLKANINREGMMWIDTARTFAMLAKEGLSNRNVAKEFNMGESKVSRMIAATALPKSILVHADDPDTPYSDSVFLALAGCDKKVLKQVGSAMEKGANVTVTDVKALIKELKKGPDQDEDGDSTEEEPNDPPTTKAVTIGKDELGKMLSVKIKEETVEIHMKVDWPKKTYRTFDPVALLSAAFEEAFEDEDAAIDSFAGLLKAMKKAKAEIG